MKLTKRQKEIVSGVYPKLYPCHATQPEITKAREAAKGHFWHDKEYVSYFAVSPTGRKWEFEYDGKADKMLCLDMARAWSKGDYSPKKKYYY